MADIFIAPKKNKKIEEPKIGFRHSLSAFSHRPDGISFQTQKEKETIILFLRSHLITNLSWFLLAIILAILPFIGFAFFPKLNFDFLPAQTTSNLIMIYVLFYYLLVLTYMFIKFLRWFYNVFIVTSERVVDIDYSDIVVHNIAVASLSHVQDVNYTQSGFIPTFFDYGDLFIQTAGDEKNFEALSVPKPREATHIIGDLTNIH